MPILALILLITSIHHTLDAASFSGTQADQYGKLEPGFIRKEDGLITVITYHPDDNETAAKLIDTQIDTTSLKKQSLATQTWATLFSECAKADEHGSTGGLYLNGDSGDYVFSAIKQKSHSKAMHVSERGGYFHDSLEQSQKEHSETGEVLQTVYLRRNIYLLRSGNTYHREGPGYAYAKLVKTPPFSPTDCAHTSGGWLATVEGGCQINLYRCPYRKESVYNSAFQTSSPEQIDAAPHEFTHNKKYFARIALRLFTKSEEDSEPLICSFAFSYTDQNRKLALIFPRQVMLWELSSFDYGKTEIKAKGKVIAQANLSHDKPLDELRCFNTAVFSRDQDALENPFLYIAGNNCITRYACQDGKLEQFRYTHVPGLSGSRTITISENGERLAVADPRAGVAVFDTKTMALLCTLLQGIPCKHLAIDGDLLATSVLNAEGKSREAVWVIGQKTIDPETIENVSLLQLCLNALWPH